MMSAPAERRRWVVALLGLLWGSAWVAGCAEPLLPEAPSLEGADLAPSRPKPSPSATATPSPGNPVTGTGAIARMRHVSPWLRQSGAGLEAGIDFLEKPGGAVIFFDQQRIRCELKVYADASQQALLAKGSFVMTGDSQRSALTVLLPLDARREGFADLLARLPDGRELRFAGVVTLD